MSRYRVAVDVGGTFTDVFVLDEDTAAVNVAKVPSTPDDPMDAIMSGVAAANVNLADVTLFSHGTTVATNALITRRFPPVAMVTTRGFRDVLEIRRGTRDDLWDAYEDVAPAIVRRRDRLEVSERIDYGPARTTVSSSTKPTLCAASTRWTSPRRRGNASASAPSGSRGWKRVPRTLLGATAPGSST